MAFPVPGEKGGIAAIPAREVSSAKVVTSYVFRDSFTRHYPLERSPRIEIKMISCTVSDRDGDYHGCFLEVFALVNERNQELARTFDDLSRANAMTLLAGIMERRLVSGEEFSPFGPETRDAVDAIQRIRTAASTSR
jgi:hypothetical protein